MMLSRVGSINIYFFLQYPDQLNNLNFLLSLLYFGCDQIAQNFYFWAQGWAKFLPAKLRISSSFGMLEMLIFFMLLFRCYQNVILFCSANNSHINTDWNVPLDPHVVSDAAEKQSMQFFVENVWHLYSLLGDHQLILGSVQECSKSLGQICGYITTQFTNWYI